jgi:hypothetical protein
MASGFVAHDNVSLRDLNGEGLASVKPITRVCVLVRSTLPLLISSVEPLPRVRVFGEKSFTV